MDFCTQSSSELKKYENICTTFNKELSDLRENMNNTQTAVQNQNQSQGQGQENQEQQPAKKIETKPRVSSTMKFYLLKKKYSKPYTYSLIPEGSYLEYEPYVIQSKK